MRQTLFLDVDSLELARKAYRTSIDYKQLRTFVMDDDEGESCAYAFLPIHPQTPLKRLSLQKRLWESGYIVKTYMGRLIGGQVYTNIPLEMALSILKLVYKEQTKRVILITNNPDFTNLIVQLRERGITVILVTFSDDLPASFTEKANRVINLLQYLVETNDEFEDLETIDDESIAVHDMNSLQMGGDHELSS